MNDILQRLKQIPTFETVPDNQLQWLINHSSCKTIQKGEYFFKKGDPIDKMNIILHGRVSVRVEQNGQYRELFEICKNEISGVLPYSRAKLASGHGIIMEDIEVLSLDKEHFKEMICEHHELTEQLVFQLTDRVREFTKSQLQDEKMMALGKISAGLAHELNNPAAAILRSAASLRKHLGTQPDKFKRVIAIRMNDAQVDTVNDVLFTQLGKGLNDDLSLMERTNQEDDLIDWLEERNIEDACDIAPNFVDFNIQVEDLKGICEQIPDKKDVPPIIHWIDSVLNTEKLVLEIEEASKRIADLVNSVKIYTHMDQTPEKQFTNIHLGIKNTLKILNHKLNKNKITIQKNFQENLPEIKAYVGELNQVWTNIIDNALDAMESTGGTLEITTKQVDEQIVVDISDTGVGIPEEIISRIFDPFFTTKDIGKGTGMGLDVVQKIIRDHNAHIKVQSKPGQTIFSMRFPIV